MTHFQADQAAIEEIRKMGGRVVHRRVRTGERYLHDGEVHTWALNIPSRFELPVLEPVKPKKQLLVIVYEICEHPEDIKKQITPALAEALVTPAYAKGAIDAGYVARIVDAPE